MTDNEILLKFTQLENEISRLRDEIVKQRRKYEDIIYNLDDDNFSGTYRAEQDNKFTQIKVDADGIRTQVEDLDKNMSTSFEQTAASIKTLTKSVNTNSKDISTIEQLSGEIALKVATYWDAAVAVEVNPTIDDNKGELENYTSQLISYDGENYYYSVLHEKWMPTDKDSIVSQFIQTKDGFRLNGDVKFNGNVFTNGDFSTEITDNVGVRIANNTIEFIGYDKGNGKEHYLKMCRNDLGGVGMSVNDGCSLYFISDGSGLFDFASAKVSGLYAVFA